MPPIVSLDDELTFKADSFFSEKRSVRLGLFASILGVLWIIMVFHNAEYQRYLNDGDVVYVYGKCKQYKDYDLSAPILYCIYSNNDILKEQKSKVTEYGFLELNNSAFTNYQHKTKYIIKTATPKETNCVKFINLFFCDLLLLTLFSFVAFLIISILKT